MLAVRKLWSPICFRPLEIHRERFKIFLLPFIRSPRAVRNFSYAVQPFTASRLKFFFRRSFVHRKQFKIFLMLFSRSPRAVRKFSSAVQPFKFIHSNFFLSRSAVHDSRFKQLGHPFVIRSVAVRFAVRTDIR